MSQWSIKCLQKVLFCHPVPCISAQLLQRSYRKHFTWPLGKPNPPGGIRGEACRKVARPGERLSQPAEDSLLTKGTTGPSGDVGHAGLQDTSACRWGGQVVWAGAPRAGEAAGGGGTCRGAWVGAGGGGRGEGWTAGSIPGAKSPWGPRSEHPLRPQGLLRAPRQPQPVPLKINRHPTIHRGLFSPPTPDGLSGDGRGPWVRAVAVFDELCTYGYPNIWSGHVLLGAGQPWRANQEPRGARGCARPSQRALINYS